jgi:CBS domain-containing protein
VRPTATSNIVGTVRDYMVSDVETLAPSDTMDAALLLERKFKIRHIPIVEGQVLVGIVTDRDLKRAMPSPLTGADQDTFERVARETLMSQLMTRSPLTISPDAPLREAVQILCEKKFGALPVVEGGALIGIITETDMLRVFLKILDAKR